MMPRWALFISGRGSNAQAVLDGLDELRVAVVVSSRAEAWGVARARRAGVPVLILPKIINWTELHQDLVQRGVSRIFLLGFMKIIPSDFVNRWNKKMWNLHPSLLPRYPGLHAIEKSYDAGDEMGVTVHEVTPGMDEGPRKLQIRTLSKEQVVQVDLKQAELLISRDEQRAVRKTVERKNSCNQ